MALESWAQISPFLPPFQCGINRNWSLAKGRGMPVRAAGSLTGELSQGKKAQIVTCTAPQGTQEGFMRPSLTLSLLILGLFSERWASETELPP